MRNLIWDSEFQRDKFNLRFWVSAWGIWFEILRTRVRDLIWDYESQRGKFNLRFWVSAWGMKFKILSTSVRDLIRNYKYQHERFNLRFRVFLEPAWQTQLERVLVQEIWFEIPSEISSLSEKFHWRFEFQYENFNWRFWVPAWEI
jgi:hypothetical protein